MPMSIVADSELNASSSIDRVGAKSKTCCPIGLCLSGLISLLFSTLAGEYRPPLWCEQGEGAECEGENVRCNHAQISAHLFKSYFFFW